MSEQNNDFPIVAWADSDFTVSDTQTLEVPAEIFVREEGKNIVSKKKKSVSRDQGQTKHDDKNHFESVHVLAGVVRNIIQSRYPLTHIAEFRTSPTSFSEGLNLLVVFSDIDLETDLRMGFLLSEIENAFIKERGELCEISYIRKTLHPGSEGVIMDYPLVVKA